MEPIEPIEPMEPFEPIEPFKLRSYLQQQIITPAMILPATA
jgi:hypothetical protein